MFAILNDAFVSLEIKMLSFFVQCSILAEFFGKEILGSEVEIIVLNSLCSSAGSGYFVVQSDYLMP